MNIPVSGAAKTFHDRNYYVGLPPWLDFDKPVYFNPMAGYPTDFEDEFEIKRDTSLWNNLYGCVGNLHKEGSENLSNMCECLPRVL